MIPPIRSIAEDRENGKVSGVQISTSLRRHYPDQVPGVEAIRLLSANGVGLPQRFLNYW
jgi:hypothetical protein